MNDLSDILLMRRRRRSGQGGPSFDFYVDSVMGDDGNSGESPDAPVRTWAGLLALGSMDGARIRIEPGSVFREQVAVPNNSRIIVPDGRAIVSGADVLANASFELVEGRTYTYAISLPDIPETGNPYASVSSSHVLQVWEDHVRMGPSLGGQSSIDGVEATTGSWWWDNSTKILYIHPADDGDPTSNGKLYEASVRTLAIHAGDGFYVEGLVGEKAGVRNGAGQQGYGILGYKSGTYKRCVGRWGWNHCGGVANSEDAGPLVFDQCEFFDHERQTVSGVSTCFIAFKQSPNPARVIVRDCLAHMPTYDAGYSDIGFFAHGASVQVEWQGTNIARRFRYGRQLLRDGGFTHADHLVDDVLVAEECRFGDYATGSSGVTERTVVAKACTEAATDTRISGVVHLRAVDCVNGAVAFGDGVVVDLPAAKVLRSTSPAGNPNAGMAVQSLGGKLRPVGAMFYQLGSAYDGGPGQEPCAAGTDSNEFSGCVRIYQNTAYSPTFSTSLAVWQGVSGLDANSVVTSTTPPAEDFEIPGWTGDELAGGGI